MRLDARSNKLVARKWQVSEEEGSDKYWKWQVSKEEESGKYQKREKVTSTKRGRQKMAKLSILILCSSLAILHALPLNVPSLVSDKDVIIDLDTAASHHSGWEHGGHHGGHGHWDNHGGNHGHHSSGE